MREEKGVPEGLNKSGQIPVFEGIGDVGSCRSCRGIGLLEHGMRVIEEILGGWLWRVVKLDEVQMGFV